MLNFTPNGWRHIQVIYTNNLHKSNRQRQSKNVQIKWKHVEKRVCMFPITYNDSNVFFSLLSVCLLYIVHVVYD